MCFARGSNKLGLELESVQGQRTDGEQKVRLIPLRKMKEAKREMVGLDDEDRPENGHDKKEKVWYDERVDSKID